MCHGTLHKLIGGEEMRRERGMKFIELVRLRSEWGEYILLTRKQVHSIRWPAQDCEDMGHRAGNRERNMRV
jgi:hypothetical protein